MRMLEGQTPLVEWKWWSRGDGDAAERRHDRDILERIQLTLKEVRAWIQTSSRMI